MSDIINLWVHGKMYRQTYRMVDCWNLPYRDQRIENRIFQYLSMAVDRECAVKIVAERTIASVIRNRNDGKMKCSASFIYGA